MAVLSAIFRGIPHQVTQVEDEIGQDIQAYKVVAQRFMHPYVCFLNTFSILLADEWLKKLYDAISLPDAGLVGATGSYESLYSSWEAIHRAQWLTTKHCAYDRDTTLAWSWLMASFNPDSLRASRSLFWRVRRFVSDIKRRRPKIADRLDAHRPVWEQAISKGSTLEFVNDFSYFPNPHIRSNVFMMPGQAFRDAPIMTGDAKTVGSNFESGFTGLSKRVLDRGQKLYVVGADGRAFDVPDWPNSGCFRSGTQANLLASDNQTVTWDRMTEQVRNTHRIMTWGGYLPTTKDPSLLGIPFDASRPLVNLGRKPGFQRQQRLLSIFIPTHDRLSLVLDAIKTVTSQNYENWEICVFDNASKDSVKEAIDALKDPRIRCERSDTFLPVTESWNRALDMARGEYVTMIGDDDGLAPDFFNRISDLADQFENPDAIFSSLYQFFHPGVVPSRPLGYAYSLPMAPFLERKHYPFLLDKKSATAAVDSSLKLRRTFMFNMPAFTVRRDFLESLRRDGQVLKPPFPDYYFANIVFETAKKLVAVPTPLAFQGVSRASFGFTLINNKTDDGFKVLGHQVEKDSLFADVKRHLLPGSGYQSQYILTMARVANEIGDPKRQPDYKRYRAIQILNQIRADGFPLSWRKTVSGAEFWGKMNFQEKWNAMYLIGLERLARLGFKPLRSIASRSQRNLEPHSFKPNTVLLNEGDFVTGFEFYEGIRTGKVGTFRS